MKKGEKGGRKERRRDKTSNGVKSGKEGKGKADAEESPVAVACDNII